MQHREGEALPPYGADLNNHSELTRRGFRNPWMLRFFHGKSKYAVKHIEHNISNNQPNRQWLICARMLNLSVKVDSVNEND